MFWGLNMEPQKRYTQTVTESFHISQAAIDVGSVNQETAPTQVILEYENEDYILATLSKSSKIYQVPLDLNFQKGDVVSFRTAGNAIIHLSGYHILEDDDDLAQRLMGGSDDDTDEEVDVDALENSVSDDSTSVPSGKKRKKAAASAGGKEKKSKLDEDSDDDEDQSTAALGQSTLDLASDSDDDEDTDNDLVDDEDDDDDDDDEGDDDDEEDEEEEEEDDDDDDEEEEETVATKRAKNGTVNGITPSGKKNKLNLSKTETPKTPKAGKQLNQSKQEKTPKQEAKTPKQDKTPKQEAKTPKQEKKTPKTATPATPGQKKVLEGGIVSEDLKSGDGPVAKPGKMAAVYYAGRLKSNNKQFDATTGGPGFKFRIGRGEVIKGWDVGVTGMRVGGKRRLTIPAALAYGARGSPPVIPPNATLVFDIELRGLS